ncbi:MAG TPA: glycosyltransferase family 2 protein [Methylomusa anaerophila]|uniref:N-glycosyltransferase n=1 Tax=Methylomusa anaerophila TaxID=1930071 RepID=A0A348AI21_9FIRM|nr:glycosyltransferase family 2 protein [Methylomusa anaerophila]BBB90719.1 N-glycosyltransferase [Methylomusa anaerophila]HML88678.1 glycosyltransferase family 2 protein [Methylomusa anaerophila]
MRPGRLRVVILNYNQPAMTVKCVASLLAQSYQPLDVVVVDNASAPANYEQLKQSLPERVVLIRNAVNAGYAAGNNVGARLSEGLEPAEYTMILNNDVFLPEPAALKNMVTALEKDADRVAVSPLVQLMGTDLDPLTGIQVRRDADFTTCLVVASWWLRRLPGGSRVYDRHVYQDHKPYQPGREYECDSINGCCFIIRTNFLASIGYFDEGTFLYFEEIILGRQIKLAQKKCCLTTAVTVHHFHGATTKQRLGVFRFHMYKEDVKSQVYYCRKYLNAGWLACSLLVFVRAVDFISKKLIQSMLLRPAARGKKVIKQ